MSDVVDCTGTLFKISYFTVISSYKLYLAYNAAAILSSKSFFYWAANPAASAASFSAAASFFASTSCFNFAALSAYSYLCFSTSYAIYAFRAAVSKRSWSIKGWVFCV